MNPVQWFSRCSSGPATSILPSGLVIFLWLWMCSDKSNFSEKEFTFRLRVQSILAGKSRGRSLRTLTTLTVSTTRKQRQWAPVQLLLSVLVNPWSSQSPTPWQIFSSQPNHPYLMGESRSFHNNNINRLIWGLVRTVNSIFIATEILEVDPELCFNLQIPFFSPQSQTRVADWIFFLYSLVLASFSLTGDFVFCSCLGISVLPTNISMYQWYRHLTSHLAILGVW